VADNFQNGNVENIKNDRLIRAWNAILLVGGMEKAGKPGG